MRVSTLSALCLLMALYMVVSVATEVFVDDFLDPRSMFATMVASTLLAGALSLAIDVSVPV